MENAFTPGDPVLELAALSSPNSSNVIEEEVDHWLPRKEQGKIDAIIDGSLRGHYYLLIGESGNGKSAILLDAMQKVNGEGISMFEAHADLEIFRIRLGKALDFEFYEEYVFPSVMDVRGLPLKAISGACSVSGDHEIRPLYLTLKEHLISWKRLRSRDARRLVSLWY